MAESVPAATNTVEPARRRNSTYLALACANAVSQGAMTRKFRQMFENPPVQETPKPLSRAEIKEAIQAARLRRNSIAFQPHHQLDDLMEDTDPTTPLSLKIRPAAPPKPAKPQFNSFSIIKQTSSSPVSPVKLIHSGSPPSQQQSYYSNYSSYPNYPAPSSPTPSTMSVLCEKCSSVVQLPTSSPGSPIFNDPVSPVSAKPAIVVPVDHEDIPSGGIDLEDADKPSNREVLPDELPKRNTVKNARSLFETSLTSASSVMNFGTLQHVKSNPSSKIFRSESVMTLDRAGIRQPFRWTTSIDEQKQQQQQQQRSPSPIKPTTKATSYYRSSPSLYPRPHHHHRHSRHSTDVESYVSEAGSDCWSTSDLDSEASYSASSSEADCNAAGNVLDGMRYISPQVMEKIRSYGMTLTFVNGIMVDEDDEQQMKEALKQATTNKKKPSVIQPSIRSAGQSRTTASKAAAATIQAAKKIQLYNQHQQQPQQQQQPVRIVACVTKKIRHSSGESSASSGVGSAGTDSSPFGTLKRTKSNDVSSERSPSPGPRRAGAAKAQTDSPFGCYSVVYQFNKASAPVTTNKNASRTPMYV